MTDTSEHRPLRYFNRGKYKPREKKLDGTIRGLPVTKQMETEVKQQAKQDGVSISELQRRALALYLAHRKDTQTDGN